MGVRIVSATSLYVKNSKRGVSVKPTPQPTGHGAVVTMDDSRAGDSVRGK